MYPNITLENISNSDDSDVMLKVLHDFQLPTSNFQHFDVHHAGTAMRFLTAFFSIQENREITLTGSSRMKERPIEILVEALKQLGADIVFLEKEGFPPIKIKGKELTKNIVSLNADVSSQYISALLLIAPKLKKGLEITLKGDITSMSYIKMTLALLNKIGVETIFHDNKIVVKPKTQNPKPTTYSIESDWSSASYFYSIIALSPLNTKIELSNFYQNSLQGDFALIEIYKNFGVETKFTETGISLKKTSFISKSVHLNLIETPDIAQTIIVTCFGLGLGCKLSGLHTLKIKETDRLEALRIELSKLGALVFTTDSSIQIVSSTTINENISIKTYEDHRMAMAFAPLSLKTNIIIQKAEVVSKSFPTFWEDLQSIGFNIETIT